MRYTVCIINFMNMNTTKGSLPVIAIVIVILLAGGGIYAVSKNSSSSDEGATGDAMMESSEHMESSDEGKKMMVGEEETEAMESLEHMEGSEAMMEGGDTMMEGDTIKASYTGSVLAGEASPLLDFTKSDYDKAVASDKLVVLYFYANWCPICKAEVANSLYPAFDSLTNSDVVGFRVSYNDSDTDKDEKALAREFGVAYQHTKVFLKDGKRVLKSPEGWDENRYLSEIKKVLQ